MVYCSGLENLDGKPQETAKKADLCGVEDAPDAMFPTRSEGSDGAEVGTQKFGMPLSEFIAMVTHELPKEDFARFRRKLPDHVFAKYTYFARCTATGAIKIGRAFDPHIRMRQIQNATGSEHELLATIRGGENESSYHAAFADHRLHGEWFAPHVDILAEIARLNSLPNEGKTK